MNRLAGEKSPYLRQHQNNPVDWYPWGDEAFEKAKREDKPIFLSIGYSTCHWCHVMERESFEREETARLLNRDYISIKVDREERPDVDTVYMAVCQAATGSGGWPLTILMTPEQKPFFAGTYLPLRSRGGMTGLLELLEEAARLWKEERERLQGTGEAMTRWLEQEMEEKRGEVSASEEFLKKGVQVLKDSYDSSWGGFGRAPKFPVPHNLLLLLRLGETEMAEHTLRQIYRGGIYDHLGGGISRYSTEETWLIPHFEKMLYDNALLAYVCCEARERTGKILYGRIAGEILDYALRELTGGDGGFYCGQDADSQGEEGKYYLWEKKEITGLLGQREGERFCRRYGVSRGGNFEGKNILNLQVCPDWEEEEDWVREGKQRLLRHRTERYQLHLDDKVLTSWNGLMLAALAKAGRWEGGSRWRAEAVKTAEFLHRNLTGPGGRLWIRWKEGERAGEGQLDDYGFYGLGLLELYQTEYAPVWLERAVCCAEQMIRRFRRAEGGFYMTADDAEQLICRPVEVYDGAVPSGNSAAGLLLVRLARLTGERRWQEEADRQIRFLAGSQSRYPGGNSLGLLAMREYLCPSGELICTGRRKKTAEQVGRVIREYYLPELAVLVKTPEWQEKLKELIPMTEQYPLPEEGEAWYLCRGRSCLPPVSEEGQIREALQRLEENTWKHDSGIFTP